MAERSMCSNRLAINLPNVAYTPMAQHAKGFETLNLDDGPGLSADNPTSRPYNTSTFKGTRYALARGIRLHVMRRV